MPGSRMRPFCKPSTHCRSLLRKTAAIPLVLSPVTGIPQADGAVTLDIAANRQTSPIGTKDKVGDRTAVAAENGTRMASDRVPQPHHARRGRRLPASGHREKRQWPARDPERPRRRPLS